MEKEKSNIKDNLQVDSSEHPYIFTSGQKRNRNMQ